MHYCQDHTKSYAITIKLDCTDGRNIAARVAFLFFHQGSNWILGPLRTQR